jgi:hypothetical protein
MQEDPFNKRVVDTVSSYLAPIRGERGRLKRLDQRTAMRQLAEELADGLADLGDHQEIVDACYYELKQQLGAILHQREWRTKQVDTLLLFLQKDIEEALERAVDRGIELYGAEPKQMQILIEETGIEIQQFLLNAKTEFINRPQGVSTGLVDTKARDLLLEEVEKLEIEYTLPSVDTFLRQKLGLIHLKRLTQELTRATQKAIARFEKEGDRDRAIEALQTQVNELTTRAKSRLDKESLDLKVKEALLSQIEKIKNHYVEEDAINTLFS